MLITDPALRASIPDILGHKWMTVTVGPGPGSDVRGIYGRRSYFSPVPTSTSGSASTSTASPIPTGDTATTSPATATATGSMLPPSLVVVTTDILVTDSINNPIPTILTVDTVEREREEIKSQTSSSKRGDDPFLVVMRDTDSPADSAFLNVGSIEESGREKLRSTAGRNRPLLAADSLSTYFSADGEPLQSLRTVSRQTPNKVDVPCSSSSSIVNSASNSSVGTSYSGMRTPGREGSFSPLDTGVNPSWQSDFSVISRLTTPAATPRIVDVVKLNSSNALDIPYRVVGQGSVSISTDDNTPHINMNMNLNGISQKSNESMGSRLAPNININISVSPKVRVY